MSATTPQASVTLGSPRSTSPSPDDSTVFAEEGSSTPVNEDGDDDPTSAALSEMPETIPPEHSNRTLVLCFDGTGDQFDQDNSNIVQFFALLKKDEKDKQLVYYQAGIGTANKSKYVTPMAVSISKSMDMALASNLSEHVCDGYEFIMQNYTAGDKISLFGFSRGAYTARALAGMIHKVGLLPACNHQQVPFAYSMYAREDDEGWVLSNGFKKCFSIDIEIDFMGLFDTVHSVGLIPRELPFAKSNSLVRTFRHAVALDERRAKFKANLWTRTSPKDEAKATKKKQKYKKKAKKDKDPSRKANRTLFGMVGNAASNATAAVSSTVYGTVETAPVKPVKPIKSKSANGVHPAHAEHEHDHHETDVLEVFFAGAHCDVGGGSVPNETRHSLARIPLRWMIREVIKTTGIMFQTNLLEDVGLDPETLWPEVLPRPEAVTYSESAMPPHFADHRPDEDIMERNAPFISEEIEDLKDSVMPIYDQLKENWMWWILELMPNVQKWEKKEASWRRFFSMNLGGPRVLRGQKKQAIKVHRAVQLRIESGQLKYEPAAKLTNFEYVA